MIAEICLIRFADGKKMLFAETVRKDLTEFIWKCIMIIDREKGNGTLTDMRWGMNNSTNQELLDFLLKRFRIEREKFDRSGVYAYTQRLFAYNSNKIEGSALTEEQTASLFDNGTLPKSDDYYRAKDVEEMYSLMDWYGNQTVDISILAEFHVRYEIIHPFQDGNGRTGRLILFRECLKNEIVPVVIEDANRNEYLEALKEYRETKQLDKMIELFKKEQQFYLEKSRYFM